MHVYVCIVLYYYYFEWFTVGCELIPMNTTFRGMSTHLPTILIFTRGAGFQPIPM